MGYFVVSAVEQERKRTGSRLKEVLCKTCRERQEYRSCIKGLEEKLSRVEAEKKEEVQKVISEKSTIQEQVRALEGGQCLLLARN